MYNRSEHDHTTPYTQLKLISNIKEIWAVKHRMAEQLVPLEQSRQ